MQYLPTFNSIKTGKEYKIKENINCSTSNVVYHLQCKLCPKDYIGKTITLLRLRTNNHRTSVLHQSYKLSASAHAQEHNISSLFDCYSPGRRAPRTDIYELKLDINLRNVEIGIQLMLKSRTPNGLKHHDVDLY